MLATLERTLCFGACPSYRIVVYADGRVEWEGRNWVKVLGPATWQLTAAEVDRLPAAFSEAGYLDLKGNYSCYDETDRPSVRTSYCDGARWNSIHHYLGCHSTAGVDILTKLEDRVDEIAKTAERIGTLKERHFK